MDWEERLLRELVFVYGENQGGLLARDLTAQARSMQQPPRVAAFDDPAEALLITYADQVADDSLSPLASLNNFLSCHLEGLLSGVHILPFFPWSSDDGFSVKNFYTVSPDLGSWKDVRAFSQNFDLMFDAVFNHASIQGDWFEMFCSGAPGFESFFTTVEGSPDLSQVVRPRALPLLTEFDTTSGRKMVWTTFSADQADLNFRDPRVMRAVSGALLLYLGQGARYIRLDAIGFIWKELGTSCLHLPEAHALVRAWRALADGAARGVRIVTETNVPHADNVSYFGDGYNEAQMVYNFALPPLVLHSLRSGDASALSRWASDLHTPSAETTFFNFLASHDGIGLNPVRGILSENQIDDLVRSTRLAGGFVGMKSLSDGSQSPYELNINFFDILAEGVDESIAIRRFSVAHAIAFALAGVPGVYFHSLFGSRGDRQAAIVSGIPRRINRQKLRLHELSEELMTTNSLRHRIFIRISSLLRKRRQHAAFAPSSPQRVLDAPHGIFALIRGSGDHAFLCLHEVSGKDQVFQGIALAPYESLWTPLKSSSLAGG